MANRYVKSYSISLIKETQISIKATMRYYLIPLVIANRKAREQVWQGCEKRESLYTLGGTVNWFSH